MCDQAYGGGQLQCKTLIDSRVQINPRHNKIVFSKSNEWLSSS